ncbi:MAG: transcriptional repressor [Verrucomicrobiae bacterium]|nr:transcriptional repressor [Verrucomicrobiae bacterium]NNJ41822.1 transcriptional repressor [Akkermansiaceae bacterium]
MENKLTDCDHRHNPKLKGLRMTRQRCAVYQVLMAHRDHPTAGEVYDRAKHSMPTISLATVYNCLEALVQHGAVRQVNFERESSRYCPNLTEHGHFHDEKSGTIIDVPLKKGIHLSDLLELPAGAQIDNLEITLRGKIIHQPSLTTHP